MSMSNAELERRRWRRRPPRLSGIDGRLDGMAGDLAEVLRQLPG